MPQFQLLNQVPTFGGELGKSLGTGFGTGISEGLQQRLEQFHKDKEFKAQEQMFIAQGWPEDLAKLGASATIGGQTAIVNQLLEMRQRQPGIFEEGAIEKGPGFEAEEIEVGLTPKEKVTRREKQDQRSFERNKKYLDRISSIAQELPKEKVALAQMKGALEDDNFNSLRNAVAEMTGFEALKSASAQTVNSASKQFLMASLAGLTGRPNQFIERQITKALISPLYHDVANELKLSSSRAPFI